MPRGRQGAQKNLNNRRDPAAIAGQACPVGSRYPVAQRYWRFWGSRRAHRHRPLEKASAAVAALVWQNVADHALKTAPTPEVSSRTGSAGCAQVKEKEFANSARWPVVNAHRAVGTESRCPRDQIAVLPRALYPSKPPSSSQYWSRGAPRSQPRSRPVCAGEW